MPHRSLGEELAGRVDAGVSGIYIRTAEFEFAAEEAQHVCLTNQWVLAKYDVEGGLHFLEAMGDGPPAWRPVTIELGRQTDTQTHKTVTEGVRRYGTAELDLVRVLQTLSYFADGLQICVQERAGQPAQAIKPPVILLIQNGHMLIKNSPRLIQMVSNQVWEGRGKNRCIAIVSPIMDLPRELEKLFEPGLIEHRLPDREQLKSVLSGVGTVEDQPAAGDPLETVIDAACGLTRFGAETAFALSLARDGHFNPATVFEVKARALQFNNRALTLYEGTEKFDRLGGLDFMKQFALECLQQRHENPLYRPRGIFLVGPPGVGKSAYAKCLGNEVGRPTLLVNLGATRSKYQGESERGMIELTERLDAMAPCVAFIDELEKAATGSKSSGATDAGTKAATIAHLLSWMNDHTSEVYVVVTCNDVQQLMLDNPEIARVGRFDAMFFLDFPGREAKDAIWEIHLRRFGFLKPNQPLKGSGIELPDDDKPDHWTGAEIEGCCRIARLRGRSVKEIGKDMPVIAKQAKTSIDATRDWANEKCYAAEYDGIYVIKDHEARLVQAVAASGSRRKVTRSSQQASRHEMN